MEKKWEQDEKQTEKSSETKIDKTIQPKCIQSGLGPTQNWKSFIHHPRNWSDLWSFASNILKIGNESSKPPLSIFPFVIHSLFFRKHLYVSITLTLNFINIIRFILIFFFFKFVVVVVLVSKSILICVWYETVTLRYIYLSHSTVINSYVNLNGN